jgi:hypothetical protein
MALALLSLRAKAKLTAAAHTCPGYDRNTLLDSRAENILACRLAYVEHPFVHPPSLSRDGKFREINHIIFIAKMKAGSKYLVRQVPMTQ